MDALLDVSRPGDVVLDPFLGSGTTLLAAERTGRLCRGVEIEPAYVDLLGNSMDLLDVHRAQYLQPELVKTAITLREEWKPNMVVVEAAGVGRGLFDHLLRHRRDGVRAFHPKIGKDERMSIESLKIESGEVRLPQNASWKETFLAETAAFPNGKYDDQVDSLSQALACVSGPSRELRNCSRFKGRMGRVLK